MTKASSWLLVAGACGWMTLAASQLTAQPAGIQRPPATSTSIQPQAPTVDYLVFVASEGNDRISLVRYGPGGISVDRISKMGRNPTEPVGPHGIGVSPDGRFYYVSTAHGFPNGELWKFTTVGDSLKGAVTLGMFPATLQVAPETSRTS
jgi:DNA-binding beta-propeller fold protein YncE